MRRIVLLLLFGLFFAPEARPDTADVWLEKLYEHYNTANQLYVRFEQTTRHTVFKKSESYRGEFWAESGRWRLALPDRLEVYDGAYLWIYKPHEKEVQKQKTSRAEIPFRPKEVLDELRRDFRGSLVKETTGGVVLRLVPKARDAATPPIEMAFHPKSFLVHTMSWEEAGDSVTVKFLRTSRNVKIGADKFVFTVPRGVKVTDLSL